MGNPSWAMSSQWTALQNVSASRPLPHLLLKYNFGADSYSIVISDLRNVWSESLDRRQIIRRALNEDTSIDPSEDASQLKILLEKLQLPLKGADNEATLRLLPSCSGDGFIAKATIPLPRPLRPLEWEFHLMSTAEHSVKEELMMPLLGTASAQSREIESLVGLLKEKDHVIERLLDKLDAAGVEVNRIFPAATGLKVGKRGLSRTELAKYVRGIGEFDETKWKQDLKQEDGVQMSEKDLIELAFSSNGLDLREVYPTSDQNYIYGWWQQLSNKSIDKPREETRPLSPKQKANRAQTPVQSDESDTDFQRQETPPHLRKRPAKARTSLSPTSRGSVLKEKHHSDDLDEETTDDDDLGGSSTRPSQDVNHGHYTRAKGASSPTIDETPSPEPVRSKKLGTIGRRNDEKHSRKPRSSPPSKSASPVNANPADQGSETEGETEGETEDPSSPPPVSASQSPPQSPSANKATPSSPSPSPQRKAESPKANPPKRRLGTIGGKHKEPEVSRDKSPSAAPESAPSSKPVRSRLGVIGGKGKAAAKVDAQSHKHSEEINSRISSSPPPGATAERQHPDGTEAEAGNTTNKRTRSGTPQEPPPPEETPEERANRRREELRKQMEEKAKAPAKKKRRF